jgi:hypothetical protein
MLHRSFYTDRDRLVASSLGSAVSYLVEVRMIQRRERIDALGGVELQQTIQQVQPLCTEVCAALRQRLWSELRVLMPVLQQRHARPDLLRGRASQLEYLLQATGGNVSVSKTSTV